MITDEYIHLVTTTLNDVMKPLKDGTQAFMLSFMSDNFTIDELQVMLEYNKSSAGQKGLSLMPQMMTQLQVMVQQQMPQIIGNFKATLQKRVEASENNEG